jgi:GAF domain-containing protein
VSDHTNRSPLTASDPDPTASGPDGRVPASTKRPPTVGLDRTLEADLAAAYRELQNLLLDRPDVSEFLNEVAALAASVVPGCSCGITMRRDHEIMTVAVSDQFAAAIDEIQYGRGQGPCLETLHTGIQVNVADLAADDRWGDYRIYALTYGVRSSLSLPLAIDGIVRGALNLYTTVPNSFGMSETRRSKAFAHQAAAALTIVLRNADQAALEHQLREALATRAVVDQAVGIIMGQRRVDSSQAFAVLREISQTRNRKLRDIAADVIQAVTGTPPLASRPFSEPR